MLVVMEEGAPEEWIQGVIDRLVSLEFTVHRSTGVRHTLLGGVGPQADIDPQEFAVLPGVKEAHRIVSPYKLASRHFRPEGTVVEAGPLQVGGAKLAVIAGPCSVESEAQIRESARIVAASGAKAIRGGAFKPRSSPYAFQGLGLDGLKMLRAAADEAGLAVVSEVMDLQQIEPMAPFIDVYQVGARNMQNFNLLRALGEQRKPVLVKRGLAASIDEWLLAAEYVMSGGNYQVMLCERGIRGFETYTRNTMDVAAIPVAKKLSHLPVLGDPSHGTGRRDLVTALALASVAAGADGLLVEVHPNPDKAVSDGAQTLFPQQFAELVARAEAVAAAARGPI